MSDCSLTLIPEPLGFLPPEGQQDDVLLILRGAIGFPVKIELIRLDELEFFDCGSNFIEVTCPGCNSTISLDKWQDWMETDFVSRSWTLRTRTLKCCQTTANLHELRYEFAQGFAKFAIEITNPKFHSISAEVIADVENHLGCKVRVIPRHL